MQQKIYCTYKTYHKTGFYYFGRSTIDAIDADYKGSGRKLWAMWMNPKTPRHAWICEILETFETLEDCKNAEAMLVNSVTLTDGFCVNLMTGGDDGKTYSQLCTMGTYGNDGSFPSIPIDYVDTFVVNINNDEVIAVNARDLHSYLNVGKDFSSWIKDRISKYDFTEYLDYIKAGPQNGGAGPQNGGAGLNKIDYHISLDMAKELSMLQNNEKGKAARKYFIKIEKEYYKETMNQKIIELENTIQQKNESPSLKDKLEVKIMVADLFNIDKTKLAKDCARTVKRETGVNVDWLLKEFKQ